MQERYSYGWDDEESKKLKKIIMAEREKTHVRYYGGKIMKQERGKIVKSGMIVRREEIQKNKRSEWKKWWLVMAEKRWSWLSGKKRKQEKIRWSCLR